MGVGEVAYIQHVNWVTYLGRVYSKEGGLYAGGVLTGFYGISVKFEIRISQHIVKNQLKQ